jgi:hypothetical protein
MLKWSGQNLIGEPVMKKIIVLAAVVLAIGGTASATWEHDKCLNIEGIQETVPEGLIVKEGSAGGRSRS